ncbi:MAG: uL22 family ribosomal protein [Candidatus Aenigmatarchaeota archaeon]
MKKSISKIRDARVSLKKCIVICKELKGKKISKAKDFLEKLIKKEISLNGKYYTNPAKKILELLKNAEADAKFKGLELERTFIKNIKADKGFTFIRPRSRFRLRGRRIKATHLTVELEER